MNWSEEAITHFRDHIDPMLPAKGADILEACNEMEDVPEGERDAVKSSLDPDKMYENIDKVMEEINMPPQTTEETSDDE